MGLIAFWGRQTWVLLRALFILAVLVALFIFYKIYSYEQLDDAMHLEQKHNYLSLLAKTQAASPQHQQPNIVFILYDDLGYADIGAGAGTGTGTGNNTMIKTPNIDQLAANGVMLSDFHSPAPVCTPSRAGYLTGRLPARAGLPNVVFPTGDIKAQISLLLDRNETNIRLPAEEITLADILGASGYRTGMVGKWHMGDRSPSLPNDMGFDEYYGALYSNDMTPFAFYRNYDIAVAAPVDQTRMTQLYTDEATRFIQQDSEQPFFLYFAHNFPHDPLWVRSERSGNSDAGLFGDVLEEIDDSVGDIVEALRDSGELDNTLIIISSDNGPWFLGDAGNQRGRKGNTFEGGMRVPFIAHWPGNIAPGRVETTMAMGTDLVPTVLDLLNLPAPTDRELDGKSILKVLKTGGRAPHNYLYYYDGDTLFAARDQRFKYRGAAGVIYSTDQMPVGMSIPQKEWLFDLEGDPRESYDTSDRHPDHLIRLRQAFNAKVNEMEANPRGWR